MDNLAHTLAGAALAEAGLKKRTALATATLLIGANLPDIDIVAHLFGHGLSFRRGWTHGVLAIVVLPLVLTAGMLAWDRWVRQRRGRTPARVRPDQLLLLSFVGVLSHPFLDWLNSYGMRWLMPLDGTWFYGDALFIIDPWIWAILLGGVVAARWTGRRRASATALGLATLYILVMLGSAAAGRRMVERGLEARGLSPGTVMVGPVAVNPNRREVVMRQGELYYFGTLTWLPSPALEVAENIVRSNRDHPAAVQAARTPEAERFLRWSRFPFFVVAEGEGGRVTVRLDDARYSDGSRPSWAAITVELPGGGRSPSLPGTLTAIREPGPPPAARASAMQ